MKEREQTRAKWIDQLGAVEVEKYYALKAHADALAEAAENAVEDTCECDACNLLRNAIDAYRKWLEEGK